MGSYFLEIFLGQVSGLLRTQTLGTERLIFYPHSVTDYVGDFVTYPTHPA